MEKRQAKGGEPGQFRARFLARVAPAEPREIPRQHGIPGNKKPAARAGFSWNIGGGVCPRTKLALVQRTAIPRPSNQQCAVVRQDFEVPLHSAIRKVLISAGTRRRSFPRAWRVVDLASLVLLALNARHRQREETQCQRRIVFERSGGSWTQIDKLQPPTLVANARYGARSVVSDRYLMLSSRNASNRNTVQVCVSAATASSSAHRSARKAATPPRVPSTSTTASAAAGPSPRRRRSRRRCGPISTTEITSVSTHATSSSVPRSWVGHSPFPVAAMLVLGPFRAGKGTSQGQAHASCTVSSPSSSIGTIRERS